MFLEAREIVEGYNQVNIQFSTGFYNQVLQGDCYICPCAYSL
jgi:hypothetical protein